MKSFRMFLFIYIGIFFSVYGQELIEGYEPNPENIVAQYPTYTNLPLPSEILVVYNANIDDAETVATYYQQARNIPSINLCPLTDLPLSVNYGSEGGAYLINWYRDANNFYNYPAQDGEVILSWVPSPGITGKAHWLYYKDYIEAPIKNYMEENNLTEIIRYIVLIKGLPYRLSPYENTSRKGASVCALLSLLNQPDERDIISLYNTNYWTQINPYWSVDYPPSLDYRFKSGHFVNAGGWYLNYLVSRLDGNTYDDVIDLIDRITLADKSGEKKWILDDKPVSLIPPIVMKYSTMPLTAARLSELGFNYRYDNLIANVTSDNDEIIGYSSHGYYAFWDSSYIWSQLQFNYVNGALFNTWESGNALSYGKWHSHFGHLSDFVVMNGSGGGGNVNEPTTGGIYREGDSYPAYAMGYSIVDAIYQGINYIAWQNDVIGDPLQTIAWGKQSLTSDLNWSGTNLVTGVINIPPLYSLSIANNSVINLKHQGFITGGELIVGQNVTFNINSWQKGLFLSYDLDYPRLVWGMHPVYGANTTYKVYRKIGTTGSWNLIATISPFLPLQCVDTDIILNDPGLQTANISYKVLAYLGGQPPADESNVIVCSGNKNPKKEMAQQNNAIPIEYSLEQNYPNPFNPNTQIKYSIKETGLVQLRVYDILGKEIATLVNENKEAGNYSIDFNASELPSGVYIYQLTTPGFTQARKMILTK